MRTGIPLTPSMLRWTQYTVLKCLVWRRMYTEKMNSYDLPVSAFIAYQQSGTFCAVARNTWNNCQNNNKKRATGSGTYHPLTVFMSFVHFRLALLSLSDPKSWDTLLPTWYLPCMTDCAVCNPQKYFVPTNRVRSTLFPWKGTFLQKESPCSCSRARCWFLVLLGHFSQSKSLRKSTGPLGQFL